MTTSEDLFAKLFNHEKVLVKDMDDLSLEAHREELAKIAFEARARLTAVDDEKKERKPRAIKGFARSVQTDDVTSDAINNITERKKKLSVVDKFREGMAKLGIDSSIADSLMSAGTIKAHLDKKNNPNALPVTEPFASSDKIQEDVKKHELLETITEQVKEEIERPKIKIVNPFAR